MDFDKLLEFITSKMRMSHIYQPVMLIALLENRGVCHQEDIASAILRYDLSQLEYYTNITNNMVGKVLRKKDLVAKNENRYEMPVYKELSAIEVEKLKLACHQRIIQYIEKHGDSIWSHRKKSSGYISGTLKYDILKRSKFHCELCGISADEKALEVDHIIPMNHGGSDNPSNLQALCYSCNSMKRDRDSTDFTRVRESYRYREKSCVFCEIKKPQILSENELSYVIEDGFPVTMHHTLIIPKRHVASYFELGQAEINSISQLLGQQKERIEGKDNSVTGFNIGINDGKDAGQTVFHCHVHLIPRRKEDVENPKGGVRHTIPAKGDYEGS